MTQAFNLSQFANKVNTSGQADLTTAVTGTLPVTNGGTGATTLGSGEVLIGAGTSAVTSVAAGTAGNVLTSNGTTWTSSAATGGQLQTQLFTAPGTWTKPASCTQVRVTVVGGGAGTNSSGYGGYGGLAVGICPVSAPVSVTVGNGGAYQTSGGASSFGSLASATGGSNGPSSAQGANGTGTVSTGTALRTSSICTSTSAPARTFDLSFGILNGNLGTQKTSAASPYSISSNVLAGAPAQTGNSSYGGVGGAVIVEFVG